MSGPIPMEQFGRDHWSALLYAETCVVDGNGRVDHMKMRDKDRRGGPYPTRIKGGEVADHDDYDCLRDLALAGLMDVDFGSHGGAIVAFTDYGWQVVAALRKHRATAPNHSSEGFAPPPFPGAARLEDQQVKVLMRSIAIFCDERADVERILTRLQAQDWDAFWREWEGMDEVRVSNAIRQTERHFAPAWIVEAAAQGLRASPVAKTVAYLTRDHLVMAVHSSKRVYEVGISVNQVDGEELPDGYAEVAEGWLNGAEFTALASHLETDGYQMEMGHVPGHLLLEDQAIDVCPHCASSFFLYEFRDASGGRKGRPVLRHFLVCVECCATKEISH